MSRLFRVLFRHRREKFKETYRAIRGGYFGVTVEDCRIFHYVIIGYPSLDVAVDQDLVDRAEIELERKRRGEVVGEEGDSTQRKRQCASCPSSSPAVATGTAAAVATIRKNPCEDDDEDDDDNCDEDRLLIVSPGEGEAAEIGVIGNDDDNLEASAGDGNHSDGYYSCCASEAAVSASAAAAAPAPVAETTTAVEVKAVEAVEAERGGGGCLIS